MVGPVHLTLLLASANSSLGRSLARVMSVLAEAGGLMHARACGAPDIRRAAIFKHVFLRGQARATRGWSLAAAVIAFVIVGCGGGGNGALVLGVHHAGDEGGNVMTVRCRAEQASVGLARGSLRGGMWLVQVGL